MEQFILKNPCGNLTSDGKTLTGTEMGGWVFASVSDTQYSSGKHRFAFRYDGRITGLGVASVDSNFNGNLIVGWNDPNKQRGLCVASTGFDNAAAGAKYPGGIAYCTPFTVGDIVEMEVDFDNGTLEFFRNSMSLGVCFNDINTLPKPMYIIACAVHVSVDGQISLIESPASTSTPNNLVATASDAKVILSWAAVTGATGYNVKRSTTAGGSYTIIASNASGTSYTDSTVTNGITYYYVVTALNDNAESANSNEASATPNKSTPLPTGNGLLRVTMLDSSEREFQLPINEIDGFINWVKSHVSVDPNCYMLYKNEVLQNSKEYLMFDKIISFEVTEFTK